MADSLDYPRRPIVVRRLPGPCPGEPASFTARASRDRGSGGEAELAVGDDLVAGRNPLRNHHLFALLAFDGDVADLDGSIRLDDVDVLPRLRCLNGGRRHDDGVRIRAQDQSHLHEDARPQRVVGVREGTLHPDRAGRRVHGVVDEADGSGFVRPTRCCRNGRRSGTAVSPRQCRAAGIRRRDLRRPRCPARLDVCLNLERLLPLMPADIGQVAAWNRERDVNRRDLVDHHQRCGVVRPDQIPCVHAERAGSPGDRRQDMRVLEVQFGVFDLRLIGSEGRLERRGIGGLGLY